MYWSEESESSGSGLGFSGSELTSVRLDQGSSNTIQTQQRLPGSAALSSPSLDAITSSQDLKWLLQSSLWAQPDSAWETLASFLSPGEPNCSSHSHYCNPHAHCPGPAGKSAGTVMGHVDDQMSLEEFERRRIRRERNKIAAARCRDRRRALTDMLQKETDQLESEQAQLQEEIAGLEGQKEKLELVLDAHKPVCKVIESTNAGCLY